MGTGSIYIIIIIVRGIKKAVFFVLILEMVKNDVLGRISNFGGYGSICLGLEINLAGSAKFLSPDFQKSKC